MNQQYSGKYPRFTHIFNDLEACIENHVLPGLVPVSPFITATDIIRTQGSCFARNMAKAFSARGVPARCFEFPEEINSPRLNEYFFRYVEDPTLPYATPVHENLYAPFRQADSFEKLRKTRLFIFTLGVAHYLAGYDAANAPAPGDKAGFAAIYPTVADISQSIAYIVKVLRKTNPDITIVLTVSPVPLNRSNGPSAVAEDCVSKSTLRAAVAEYLRQGAENIYYWPSFEIVRWLGAHLPPVYGAEDGQSRHVNQAMIDLIVNLFLKYYLVGYAAR